MELRISRYKLVPKDDDSPLVRLRFFRHRCVPGHNVLSHFYTTPMTDPFNSYDSEEQPCTEDISYDQEEHDEYRDSMFDEPNWSDRATRIIRFVLGSLLLIFSIVWMFIRFQL